MPEDDLSDEWSINAPVWLAQGVLAERLGITVEDAARVLENHAERTGAPPRAVADDVVAFRLLINPRDHYR